MITFGSSIVCMDHINFERDVNLVDDLGVDFLHLDVMDGNFVPRYGIYPEIVKRMAQITDKNMDLHLMVNDPLFAINQFKDIDNIKFISVHIEENEKDILRIVDSIRNMGKKAGIVLNLNTPVSSVKELIKNKEIDSVMFMGIHPGVLVQKSRPDTVKIKAKELTNLCKEYGDLDMIQCDGAVTFETISTLADSGITNFVCGSSTLYKGVDLAKPWSINSELIVKNFQKMKDLIA
jgi:ribulose-phosphate 3-epimerase